MGSKFLKWVYQSLFLNTAPWKMALASSVGLLLGLMPFFRIRIPLAIGISLLFRLNMGALLLGIAISYVLPAVYAAFSKGIEYVSVQLSMNNIGYLSFDRVQDMEPDQMKGFIVSGAIVTMLAVLLYPILKRFYQLVYSTFQFNISSKKMALSTAVGLVLSISQPSMMGIVLGVLGLMFFKLNLIALVAGIILGMTVLFPVVNILLLWVKDGGQLFISPSFHTAYLSYDVFFDWISNSPTQLLWSSSMAILLSALSFPVFKAFYNKTFSKKGWKEKDTSFVFFDPLELRWSQLKKFGVGFLILPAFLLMVLMASFIDVQLPDTGVYPKEMETQTPISVKDLEVCEKMVASMVQEESEEVQITQNVNHAELTQSAHSKGEDQEIYAFVECGDEGGFVSLNKNKECISTVIPDMYSLDRASLFTKVILDDSIRLAQKNHIKVMPRLDNFYQGTWDIELLKSILYSEEESTELIKSLAKDIKENQFEGINIAFRGLEAKDSGAFYKLLERMYPSFKTNKLQVTVSVPFYNEAYDLDKINPWVDKIFILPDRHYEGSGKKEVMASSWDLEQKIQTLGNVKEKLVITLCSYGYDWSTGGNPETKVMAFDEIMEKAADGQSILAWHLETGTPDIFDGQQDGDGSLCFMDAPALYNMMKVSMNNGIDTFALGKLGYEDDSVWTLLLQKNNLQKAGSGLEYFKSLMPYVFTGQGSVWRVVGKAEEGKRQITFDKEGLITEVAYEEYPRPIEVEKTGRKENAIVFAFEGEWENQQMAQILDVLDRYQVKGTFFVTRKDITEHPEVVARMDQRGDEIGNSIFPVGKVDSELSLAGKLKLNAMQRALQGVISRSTKLSSISYREDTSTERVHALLKAIKTQKMGYINIVTSVKQDTKEEATLFDILDTAIEQGGQGNIIYFTKETMENQSFTDALEEIIEYYESREYNFLTTSELLGANKEKVMPPVKLKESVFTGYWKAFFYMVGKLHDLLYIVFVFGMVLIILRFVFILYFGIKQKRKLDAMPVYSGYEPFVSVVIAAYNEEKVISKTLYSILKSEYVNYEIIVVNDGSTDHTEQEVLRHFEDNPKVRVITKPNGGKASAVNRGFEEAKGEIVMLLDADTLIDPKTLRLLSRHFVDDHVAAVSGGVKVGNVHNLLTGWQHIEYVTGFGLERRAMGEMDILTVVPGAIGAWRKEAVQSIGLYKEDTLTEDADITIAFLEKGYRIVYEGGAKAYTEAPADIKSFIKQRVRWTFGMLQCLWKRRGMLLNNKRKRLGFIALPNIIVSQFLFYYIAPIGDIVFFNALLYGNTSTVLVLYLIFVFTDTITAICAFVMENEKKKVLWWLPLQRIAYRYLMIYIVFKSTYYALKGIRLGWNKLKRMGNVTESAGTV